MVNFLIFLDEINFIKKISPSIYIILALIIEQIPNVNRTIDVSGHQDIRLIYNHLGHFKRKLFACWNFQRVRFTSVKFIFDFQLTQQHLHHMHRFIHSRQHDDHTNSHDWFRSLTYELKKLEGESSYGSALVLIRNKRFGVQRSLHFDFR